MDETIDLPDGWHLVPGDEFGDGGRPWAYGRRYTWKVYVKNKNPFFLYAADFNDSSYIPDWIPSIIDSKFDFVEQYWGCSVADCFEEPELPELWPEDFVIGG